MSGILGRCGRTDRHGRTGTPSSGQGESAASYLSVPDANTGEVTGARAHGVKRESSPRGICVAHRESKGPPVAPRAAQHLRNAARHVRPVALERRGGQAVPPPEGLRHAAAEPLLRHRRAEADEGHAEPLAQPHGRARRPLDRVRQGVLPQLPGPDAAALQLEPEVVALDLRQEGAAGALRLDRGEAGAEDEPAEQAADLRRESGQSGREWAARCDLAHARRFARSSGGMRTFTHNDDEELQLHDRVISAGAWHLRRACDRAPRHPHGDEVCGGQDFSNQWQRRVAEKRARLRGRRRAASPAERTSQMATHAAGGWCSDAPRAREPLQEAAAAARPGSALGGAHSSRMRANWKALKRRPGMPCGEGRRLVDMHA